MADDSNFRSNRPVDQRWPAKPAAPSREGNPDRNDPLAELARLIGQNEPFSDLKRATPGPSPAQSRPTPASMPKAHIPPAAPLSPSDPHGSPLQTGGRQFGYPEPQQQDFQPAHDPAIYGTRQQEQAPGYPSDTDYDDPAHGPHAEEVFEEDYGEERPRRGLKIALVLAGLAIIGTSGVLGYRVVFSGAPSGPPPVIKANTTPSKIVPEPVAEASNKQIYDRVGDASESERVVPREEKPVEVKPVRVTSPGLPPSSGAQDMAIKDNSRPPARANSAGLAAASGAQDMAMAASSPLNTDPGGPASAEPRKIRTVTIRPDQAGSNGGTGNIPAPRPTPPVTRPAAAAPVAPAAVPVATPTPTPTPVQAAPSATSGNAPLSLTPQIASADATARAPAFPTPAAASPPAAPARLAAVPPAAQATSGAYSVQISSQRNESEAQVSFRSLQAKFPNQLGDRQPIIRRADLGEKGIYFRTMVGPFASVDQATQFCGSLKSAGGQCVVQRN